jgi:hypothetical protein
MAGKATLVESETYFEPTWFSLFSLSVFYVKWCWFISQNIILISIYLKVFAEEYNISKNIRDIIPVTNTNNFKLRQGMVITVK